MLLLCDVLVEGRIAHGYFVALSSSQSDGLLKEQAIAGRVEKGVGSNSKLFAHLV